MDRKRIIINSYKQRYLLSKDKDYSNLKNYHEKSQIELHVEPSYVKTENKLCKQPQNYNQIAEITTRGDITIRKECNLKLENYRRLVHFRRKSKLLLHRKLSQASNNYNSLTF